jgi:hypothetical protein
MVSKRQMPEVKSEQLRPQPRKPGSSFFVLTIVGMVIAPGGVGLPEFQQHIAHRRSGAVDHPAFDSNAFAFGVRRGELRAKIFSKI